MFNLLVTVLFTSGAVLADPSAADIMQRIDATQYAADVTNLASSPRTTGTPGWQSAQALCTNRLLQLGFHVGLHTFPTGVNVIGWLPGTVLPDQQVFLSAHYDSVAQCPGADDNATGVAGVLAAAGALSSSDVHPRRTLVVACWDQEEPGMIGSTAYANDAKAAGNDIVMSYVFEMIGYRDTTPNSQVVPQGFAVLFPGAALRLSQRQWRGDTIAFVANQRGVLRQLNRQAAAVDVPTIDLYVPGILDDTFLYQQLKRSDHAAFWDAGYHGVMVTDTANYRNFNYHCLPAAGSTVPTVDAIDTVDFDFAVRVVQAVTGAVYNDLMVQTAD